MNQDSEGPLGSMGTKMCGLGPDRLHLGLPVCGMNTGQDAQVALSCFQSGNRMYRPPTNGMGQDTMGDIPDPQDTQGTQGVKPGMGRY